MIAILRGASNSAIIYSLGLRNCLHTLESNDKNSIVTVKVVWYLSRYSGSNDYEKTSIDSGGEKCAKE